MGETLAEPASDEPATLSRRSARSKTTNGYSGRILVRMPSELHHQLALAAEREDISLNRYVNDALTSSVEADPSTDSEAEEAPHGGEPVADDSPGGARSASASGLRVALATNLAIVVLAGIAAVVLLVLAVQHGL
jgi:hypothetical protein